MGRGREAGEGGAAREPALTTRSWRWSGSNAEGASKGAHLESFL